MREEEIFTKQQQIYGEIVMKNNNYHIYDVWHAIKFNPFSNLLCTYKLQVSETNFYSTLVHCKWKKNEIPRPEISHECSESLV